MKLIFFSKYSKFNVDFRNVIKNPEKVFGFRDIGLELVAINIPEFNENTCNRQ